MTMSAPLLIALLFAYYVVFPVVGMAFAGLLLAVLVRTALWIFRVGK
jgi:hypothetical protein